MKKIKKRQKKNPASHCVHKTPPLSYYDQGVLLFNHKNYDEAIISFQKALEAEPNLLHAYNYLGNIFQEKKQFDQAVLYYQKALQINPENPTAYINLGIFFHNTNEHQKAIQYFNTALQLNPNLYQAYEYMGLSLSTVGSIGEAIECYQTSLSINPNSEMTLVNLGNLIAKQGKPDEAEYFYRRALQINPNNFHTYKTFLFSMLYNPKYNQEAIFSEHRQIACTFAEPLSVFRVPHTNQRTLSRKLRIGYVSPDFRRHAVAYFIEPVLAAHNRDHFEVFCYTNADLFDDISERIKANTDQWRDIRTASDEKAAEVIRNDTIDILIDLAGHTANSRILLFARKPAPVQSTWIGYPPTTGFSTIDYKIVDQHTDPPGMTERFYSEKLLRLPESFVCYLPDRESPEVGPFPVFKNGHITFGSFNIFKKVTPHVLDVWARILTSVSGSCLILKNEIFSDETTCRHITDMFRQRGVTENRITLQSEDPSPKHLASYNLVDIGLDTFPFNGLTTTCEAMWMGVPVVTIAGSGYAARAGVSLLTNVGLTELIAKTPDEYVSIAVNLARDIQRLQFLREHLRDMMTKSPLCDSKRFTANLETCYRRMWETWCRKGVRTPE